MESLRNVLARRGVLIPEEETLTIVGRKLSYTLDRLAKKHGFTADIPELRDQIAVEFRDTLERNLPMIPGCVDAVRAFASAFPLALVSGSCREEIEWALGKLGIRDCFQALFGAEDYAEGKPSPQGYLAAMKKLGVAHGCGVAFEDSVFGIQSARAAGLSVVAIEAANHFGHDQSAADARLPHFEGIGLDWLLSFPFPAR